MFAVSAVDIQVKRGIGKRCQSCDVIDSWSCGCGVPTCEPGIALVFVFTRSVELVAVYRVPFTADRYAAYVVFEISGPGERISPPAVLKRFKPPAVRGLTLT